MSTITTSLQIKCFVAQSQHCDNLSSYYKKIKRRDDRYYINKLPYMIEKSFQSEKYKIIKYVQCYTQICELILLFLLMINSVELMIVALLIEHLMFIKALFIND